MNRSKKAAVCVILDNLLSEDDPLDIASIHFLIDSAPNYAPAVLMKERERHFRLGHQVKEDGWVTLYLDHDFHNSFRMKKNTYMELVRVVEPLYPVKGPRGDAPRVNVEKALLITLYYLAHQISMNEVGNRFGVCPATVYKEINLIVDILCSLKNKFIVWPREDDIGVIKRQFLDRARYPGVIGAIDGCHIDVLAPASDQASYSDRKMNHSIILQGICTATRIFTNVSIGTPGSRNDCRALAHSSFYQKVISEGSQSLFYADTNHLVGDKAYPNRMWLMAPYKDYGNLARTQRVHNYKHSSTRTVIEHKFGLLKGRWRRMLGLTLKDVGKDSDFVLSCCVLHNFCHLHNDNVISEMVSDDRRLPVQAMREYSDDASKRLGDRKRDEIANLL